MSPRPFRFLADARGVANARALAETARRAESMGVDVLVFPDHLIEQLSPVPAMATVAAVTERIRVAAFVFNNDLRHPAVLAQDLASLDVLSDGRLEVAMGAGWNQPEYDAIGLAFDPVGTRVSRLTEAIRVLKGCFSEGRFRFAGDHYTIREYDAQPKPVQRPHPPFFIGGGGKRLLSLAGREANTVGLAPRLLPGPKGDPHSITVAATEEKIAWVRAAAGDRFEQIELNTYPSLSPIVVTDSARSELEALAARLRARTGLDVDVDDLNESPHIFIGSVDSLVEKFVSLRERLGISSFMVGEVGVLAPVVERLAGT